MLDEALTPALGEGLLVLEPGLHDAMRFRHDRIREAVLAGLDQRRRRGLRLSLARRLAGVPRFSAVAAEQYLPVVDAIDDAGECARAVGLLRRAAVSGETPNHNVPISIIADDPAVLKRIAGRVWNPGLRPCPQAPVWPMSAAQGASAWGGRS